MNVWRLHEFRIGFGAGSVATVLLLLGSVAAASREYRRPLPLGGLAFAAAGLWSIDHSHSVPGVLVVSVAGLAAVASLGSLPGFPRWASFVMSIPFAWAIGYHAGVPQVGWLQVVVAAAASAGALLVGETDVEWRDEAPAIALFALSIAGVYLAVPDTEQAAALLGVILPLTVLGWPLRIAALGRSGAAAATALLVWAAAVGARGRPPSLVGAIACLGLLVGLPLGRAMLPPLGTALARLPRHLVLILLGVAQAIIAFVGSRVAGDLDKVGPAVGVAVLVAAGTVLIAATFRASMPSPNEAQGLPDGEHAA